MGGTPNMRSEVFTLAAVIYQMATGRRAFDAPTFPTLLGAMLRSGPARPSEAQPGLPPQVDDTLLKALSQNPAERPETAVALAAALFAKPRS